MGRTIGPVEASIIERASAARARLISGQRPVPQVPERHREEELPSPSASVVPEQGQGIPDFLVFPPLPRTGALKWRDIVDEVCAKHNVSVTEICGEQRTRGVVAARYEVFYRLSKETGMSLAQIGRHVGERDHTTVLYGVRKHLARMGKHP